MATRLGSVLSTLRKEEKTLAAELEKIRSAISALGGENPFPRSVTKGGRTTKRRLKSAVRKARKMTAAQKKVVSQRMRKYWAGRRRAKR